MVTTLAVIGGTVVAAALAFSGWYAWTWFKGMARSP